VNFFLIKNSDSIYFYIIQLLRGIWCCKASTIPPQKDPSTGQIYSGSI